MKPRYIVILAGILLAAGLPWLGPTAIQFDAATAAVDALAILSLVLLTGYVGQISLCQASFIGLSAYVTAALVTGHGWNYFAGALMGVLSAFVMGLIVGLPALRLRGILLAIVTVGVALVFDNYIFIDPQSFGWLNGGVSGWQVQGASLFGIQLDATNHVLPVYWLILGIFVEVSILVVNLHNSGAGRRFRAIRDSELAASTMGVDLTRYKLLAFGISAAIAGLAGAMFPLALGSVSSYPFSLFYSLQFAAFGVLMGIRFVPAAALGGFFMAFVPEFLSRIGGGVNQAWFSLFLGALLVVQLIIAPDGVWANLTHDAGRLQKRISARIAAGRGGSAAEPVVP
jgi:ABC-type branched-subunit amino acid transport system permease subunit